LKHKTGIPKYSLYYVTLMDNLPVKVKLYTCNSYSIVIDYFCYI